jgi:hypothetical protein
MPIKLPRTLIRAAGHIIAYGIWIQGLKLLALTLITYFLRPSNPRLQEMNDAYSANEITFMGFGGLFYIFLLRALNPMTSTTTTEIFTPKRFEKRFAPGFLHGSLLALGVVIVFLASGFYHYLGLHIQFEDAPLWLTNILLRIGALGCLTYCEEFIFRHKILNYLRKHLSELPAAAVTAVAYCGIKALQFDLGLMHIITLFLLSMALAMRTALDGDFTKGAGLWAGLLIVIHPLLSLPAMGNEFHGILMLRYELPAGLHEETSRIITGGAGGPLSSVTLQALLLVDFLQSIWRNKKILLNPLVQRIR